MPESDKKRIARIKGHLHFAVAACRESGEGPDLHSAKYHIGVALAELRRLCALPGPPRPAAEPDATRAALPNPQVRPEQPYAQQDGAADNKLGDL